MGSDNILSIHKWKNYELLLRDYEIFIYRRREVKITLFSEQPNIHYRCHFWIFPQLKSGNDPRGKSIQYWFRIRCITICSIRHFTDKKNGC